jgi:hypothetical protein
MLQLLQIYFKVIMLAVMQKEPQKLVYLTSNACFKKALSTIPALVTLY